MADVMRRDPWDGPGLTENRLHVGGKIPLGAQIEGGNYDYDEDVVFYHSDYPNAKDARKIVDGDGKHRGVGMANARAAFFLGHTGLLGLGEGTSGASSSLSGIANYHANDAKDAEIVVAQAGDTFDTPATAIRRISK